MQRIIVLNSKGGCGKTTIATNLASLYAAEGVQTALLDYDPQASSMRWLNLRSKERPPIYGNKVAHTQRRQNVTRSWQNRVQPDTERVIIDAPAGVDAIQLNEYMRNVDTVLVPVLPSPIDIHAATRFIEDLLLVGKVRQLGIRVGVVANRTRKHTKVYQSLDRFLTTLKLPFITSLRDSQNYVHAAARGIGVHEMWDSRAAEDKQHWFDIYNWVEENQIATVTSSSSATPA